MKTSACSILDFETKRSRPFAFFLLLLQSQYPDLLLLFNHFKDVVVRDAILSKKCSFFEHCSKGL